MADRVVLHIGSMKSGTSFIQSALMGNADVLRTSGYAYLGTKFGRQSRAVRQVLAHPRRPEQHPRWTDLAREAAEFEGHAGIISMEFLSFAKPGQVAALLKPFAGFEVQVVVTVRDQFRAIPAQWQTYARNLGQDEWETYLRAIDPLTAVRGSRAHTTFHRAQDVAPLLTRWAKPAAVSRIDAVTVPPAGAPRDELWRRFCEVTGIPAEGTQLDGLHDNASLGYASCDYLRRLNAHLAQVRPRRYRKLVRPLAGRVLAPLRDQEARPELDLAGARLARDRNLEMRAAFARLDCSVTGSLDDLPVPEDLSARPTDVAAPAPGQVHRAAVAAWDHLAGILQVDLASRPEDLDLLVQEGARMLRRARRTAR